MNASVPTTPTTEAMARLEMTDADLRRFLSKVDTSGACWQWTGGNNGSGYGQFHHVRSDGRRQRYAHRVAYELWVAPIPDGLTLDHTCENGARGCVTPAHLRAIPMAANVMLASRGIMAQKARQSHCVHGHPLSGDNLYLAPRTGRRGCHTCRARWRALRDPEKMREYGRMRRLRQRDAP